MAVSSDYMERLIYDFKINSRDIVDKYNLTHLRNSEALVPLTSVVEEFILVVQNNFGKSNITEAMLDSEKRMYLRTVEQKALEISKSAQDNLNGIKAKVFAEAPVDNSVWQPVIQYSAHTIDKITKKHARLIESYPDITQDLDQEFSKVLQYIELSYNENNTKANADKVNGKVKRQLNAIDRKLTNITRNMRRKATRQEITERQSTSVVGDWVNGVSDGSQIGGVFGRSNRMPKSFNHSPIQGSTLPTPHNDLSAYRTVPPGIHGFSGHTTAEELREQHPEGANPAHIRAMQYFMNQGLSFEEAHAAAISYGYEPEGGARNMDLDRKINHLGGGADPLF